MDKKICKDNIYNLDLCKVHYTGKKFYILDYVEFESDNHLKFKNRKIDKLKDLIQLRNEGLVITRYFLTNIEVEKYLLKMIGN